MDSLLLSALLAAAPLPAATGATEDAVALDAACYRLMASLADDEDVRVRTSARVAANYFLGRIDAVAPDIGLANIGARIALDDALLGRCGAALEVGGHDFRHMGETLAASRNSGI